MKSFYIKERQNPQIGTYYVGLGQLTKSQAKRAESAIYGSNIMHEYKTEKEYQDALAKTVKP